MVNCLKSVLNLIMKVVKDNDNGRKSTTNIKYK